MTSNTSHAIRFFYWLILLSISYLISLSAGMPLVLTSLVAGSAGWMLAKFTPVQPEINPGTSRSDGLLPTFILVAALSWILYEIYPMLEKNGHWDAWWFWNVRANFLSRPDAWKLAFSGQQFGTPFTVPVAHADYPPFLPLIIGFCWRLLGNHPNVVPFAWSTLALFSTASLLFYELYRRNKIVGITALILLLMQKRFLHAGISQMADPWIALFLLLALMSYQAFRTEKNVRHLMETGAMLGCCLWTKNEGLLVAAVFCLFLIPDFFHAGNLKAFIKGISIPAVALLIFKLTLAPSNDVISAHNSFPWELIRDGERYKEIGRLTWEQIKLYYPAIPYLLMGSLICCLFLKKVPGKTLWILLFIFAGYLSVFVITPHNLGWHVNTSVDRLIAQCLPGLIWVVAFPVTRMSRGYS